MDWNFENLGQFFQVLSYAWVPWRRLFDLFFLTLQEYFVYG